MDDWPFHPVMPMPGGYWVLDLTRPPVEGWEAPFPFTVGRYDEVRPWMYSTPLFGGTRNVHIGLDLGGPEGTPVHAFADGRIHAVGFEEADGGYGSTVVTVHDVSLPAHAHHPWAGSTRRLWALHGHLARVDLERWKVGDSVAAGEVIGHLGGPHENGGWAPHVHLQLAVDAPDGIDMEGVVTPEDREDALERHPDPRLVVGPLY
ncbi:MAG: hypothetical protein CMB41_05345 [Euryarchaeota archaeon]|nr:hypothetical protein [Euryarchaeota archaeon]|tara:strand:- start:6084 stop:6698 length:615 start_codon:yes stop_codon:yes gene_type:complete